MKICLRSLIRNKEVCCTNRFSFTRWLPLVLTTRKPVWGVYAQLDWKRPETAQLCKQLILLERFCASSVQELCRFYNFMQNSFLQCNTPDNLKWNPINVWMCTYQCESLIIHLIVLTQSSIYYQSKHTIYLAKALNRYTMTEYGQYIKIFSITTFSIGNVLIYLKCHQMGLWNSSLSFWFLITSPLRQ